MKFTDFPRVRVIINRSEVFPHAACTVTLVDRLMHRAEIISIDGDSYRLKEATERAASKSAARAKKRGS